MEFKEHYVDPLIADMSRRYRGNLILSAFSLLEEGDTCLSEKILGSIEAFYPYSKLSPGSFTLGDTTYYEGKKYLELIRNLKEATNNPYYSELESRHSELLDKQKQEWLRFYQTLSPSQRKMLSNRSRRLLL